MSVTIFPCTSQGRRVPEYETFCNVANENARALLASVGIDAGEYLTGEIGADEVAGVLEDVEAAMRSDAGALVRRAAMIAPGDAWRVEQDDRRVCQRLAALETVLVYAEARGLGVAWS